MENIRAKAAVAGFALLLSGFAVVAGLSGPAGAGAEGRHRLAVLPFEIEDNSGEVGDPGRHRAMLEGLTRIVGETVAASGLYDVVPQPSVAEAIAAENSGTYLRRCNGCELDIARSVGASHVMTAWIFKMSTLILTLHVVIKDAVTGDVVYSGVFDFRGDNEKAWRRAADYMVRALANRTTKAATTTD